MEAVIYCRVSSADQVEGTSLDSQERLCREYATARSITIQRVFVDRGESAKYADRPQLLELIRFCRAARPRIDTVIVWKIDRLARNVIDHFQIKSELRKHGASVQSVTEPIGFSPEGHLMETMLAGFAQFDNDIRTLRTIQGMRERIRQGYWPWHPPIGYRRADKRGDPDEPDPFTFEFVRSAWHLMATGQYTRAGIVRLLESQGVRTHRGTPLNSATVDRLFVNSYYAGLLVDPWSGEAVPGKHTAMISSDVFRAVQTVMHRGRSRTPWQKKNHPLLPLRGIICCPQCNRPTWGSVSTNHRGSFAYYHCRPDCRWRSSSASVHERVVRYLNALHDGLGNSWFVQPPEYQRQLGRLVPMTAILRASAGTPTCQHEKQPLLAIGDPSSGPHLGDHPRIFAFSSNCKVREPK